MVLVFRSEYATTQYFVQLNILASKNLPVSGIEGLQITI
jgi:hypothetical protein